MKNPARLISTAATFCICLLTAVANAQVPAGHTGYQSQFAPFEVHGMPPAMPSGYGLPGPHMGGYGMPQGAARGGFGGMPAPVLDHYVQKPDSQWDSGGPIESFLTTLFTRSRLRVDYMMWNLDEPGNVSLGAPINLQRSVFEGGSDSNVPFEIFDPASGATLGSGIVPTLRNMTLNDINGVRGNLVVPFRGGSVEANVWGLEQKNDLFSVSGISDRRVTDPVDPTITRLGTESIPNIVIPFLTNGTVTDPGNLASRVYDDSFSAELSSQMWGAEVNIFTDYAVPGNGFKFEPMYGFRFINLQESFDMVGTRTNGGAEAVQTDTTHSRANNNVYGPSIGFKTALVHDRFVLEAVPRVTFALNNYSGHTRTTLQELDDAGVPFGTSSSADEDEVDYTTAFQVSLSARAYITPRFWLFGGYDFMWVHRLSRPYGNLNYNSTTDDLGATIFSTNLNSDLESAMTHGFSVGGEFNF
ncbi:BBP7 family outer membrane beta-barrel protein [bacterium]|nr:BBP7 family outer membrane beta-barrel protein [bacterium]